MINFETEVAAWMAAFDANEISKEEWLNMRSDERAFLAGAIAGNFAAYHSVEAFEWLKQRRIQDGERKG